jgi:hypothetical protein
MSERFVSELLNNHKTGSVRLNVTSRRDRETIVAVEKQ